ncbi:Outer membrane receptor for ferric coprogen and ferric-rhodotorulic acid [Pseudomonas orientalis]|nr:Outer membrane receptor for ferric coprogen and ferric-rhodotorulic acid [Pseudomonas orientalis]
MLAPFTRSISVTLGLFSLALSPELLAETDPEQPPPAPSNWTPPASLPKAWARPPSTPAPTPQAR